MTRIVAFFFLVAAVTSSPVRAQATMGRDGAPTPASTVTTQATPSDYVVGTQDVLKVTVYDEPSMSGVYRVDPDGSFQYPMLGRLRAIGFKPREIADSLKAKLEDGYIRTAQVTVEVEQFRNRSIFIVGEVRSPGKYPMSGDMTLIEALAAAGSTTQQAGTEVLVLRPRSVAETKALTPEQSEQANVTRISLNELQLGRLSQNVSLMEGDTVFVPKAEKFFITGQVRTPGAYTYEPGLTVLQAISLAGGLTEKGSNRRIKVIRSTKTQKMELTVDLDDKIQPGDTLVIAQRLL